MEVKVLRAKLNMTQEDFARELGVTIGTVSRWENGKKKPSKLARRQLERLGRQAGMAWTVPASEG